MHLYHRYADCSYCICNGDRGVSVTAGIDYHPVCTAAGRLYHVYKLTLDI